MFPVWDWPVRIIHWYFPIAIAFMWWSGEQGEMVWHSWVGYSLVVAVITRLIWGFVGSRHALFRSFLKSPKDVIAYIKGRPFDGVGHNPLGGWSTILLLMLVLIQGASGLFSADDLAFEGPFAYWAGDLSPVLSEVHEVTWLLLQIAVLTHLLAIAYYVLLKRQPLVSAMLRGRGEGKYSDRAPRSSWLALSIALVVFGLLSLLIALAPVPPPLY